MMGLFKYISFMFLFIGFICLFVVVSTSEHEYLHQLIFEKYGINSTVHYNFWNAFKEQANPSNWKNLDLINMEPLATTHPIVPENSSYTCNETCEMLHTQVEIVDHAAQNVISVMFVLFLFYIMYHQFFKTDVKAEFKKALEEDLHEQEVQLLKDEYFKLTGKKWEIEIVEEKDASNKTSDGNEQSNNSFSSDTLDSNRNN